ncbi:MAG: Sua5 family C-terminal domain-containing protein, partial [Planctomycetota bacterium]
QIVPNAQELDVQVNEAAVVRRVLSPGLKHAHYQPRAEVRLVDHPCERLDVQQGKVAYCGLQCPAGIERASPTIIYPSVEAYAAGFYEFLREADRQSIPVVFVQKAPNEGIGRALLDRQRRASGG